MRVSRGSISGVVALGLITTTAAIAIAAPTNGNFEKGSLKGWDQTNEGDGLSRGMAAPDKWKAYKGKLKIPDLGASRGQIGPSPKLEEPPQGKYAAGVASTGPGLHILHRVLNAKGESKLTFLLAYNNTAEDFYSPDSFEYGTVMRGGGDSSNQQLRIDIMDPGAPIKSLDPVDIRETVFQTMPGDPLKRKYAKVKATVPDGKFRLRIAEVDNQSNFLTGVDAVKLKKK